MNLDLSRRDLFAALTAAGFSSPTFGRAVAAEAEKPPPARITADSVKQAEWIAGLELSDNDRAAVVRIVTVWQGGFRKFRDLKIGNAAPRPLTFNPAPAV